MTTKVRKTVTLDPDLVEEYAADASALSTRVNEVLRADKEHRERMAAFDAFVTRMLDAYGPVDPEVDAEVAALFDQAEVNARTEAVAATDLGEFREALGPAMGELREAIRLVGADQVVDVVRHTLADLMARGVIDPTGRSAS